MSDQRIELQLPEGVSADKATVLTLRPGDVLALITQHSCTAEMAERIQTLWRAAVEMDDIRVVVMSGGLDIAAIVRREVT